MNSLEKLKAALYVASTECLEGKHGNGNERVHSLRKNGFSDEQIRSIQRTVNGRIAVAIKENLDK